MEYNNLDETQAFKKLQDASRTDVTSLLTEERINSLAIREGAFTFYYAALPVDEPLLDLLQDLGDEQKLIEKYRLILSGEEMNTGEKRKVLHHLTRGAVLPGAAHSDLWEREQFYRKEQEKINTFAAKVHSGAITGSTGKPFTTVVQIGIGGSDLGPRALYLALRNFLQERGKQKMAAHFISNVDPDDAAEVMESIDIEESLFIIVSKSGTTQETLTNMEIVLQLMKKQNVPGFQPEKHMVAVTSETSPLASSKAFLTSFFIDDYIGGRYSSTSAVGGAVLTLAFGAEPFAQLLEGAHEADTAALEPDIRKNASLMDALIGVYMRNILGYPVSAILPYSQALSRFPAHLQQLDMESNGKSVNRLGSPVSYKTGPVIFGEPGTNGQHSFYQLLHQGSDIVPLQFIGFKKSQKETDISIEGSTSQMKLNANLAAQITAFAKGQSDKNPNKNFSGGRPSSLLLADQLTPKALGTLLAHYENKILFQGLVWNINSFDQEGVQLGKILARQILSGSITDTSLRTLTGMLL